jgi:hypothetical protein
MAIRVSAHRVCDHALSVLVRPLFAQSVSSSASALAYRRKLLPLGLSYAASHHFPRQSGPPSPAFRSRRHRRSTHRLLEWLYRGSPLLRPQSGGTPLEAELGRALDGNDESCRRTTRGFKIAQADLRRRIAEQRQVLSRLENRLRHTPGQISAQSVDRQRMLPEDRRLLVNALKVVTANAERMLALRFDRVYECSKDAFSIFRGLLQLPEIVRRAGPILAFRLTDVNISGPLT